MLSPPETFYKKFLLSHGELSKFDFSKTVSDSTPHRRLSPLFLGCRSSSYSCGIQGIRVHRMSVDSAATFSLYAFGLGVSWESGYGFL